MELNYDWSRYEDGRVGLVFTPPRLPPFEEAGLGGSGHDWERLLRAVLPRLAPGALSGTDFDCESDLFVAINRNPLGLEEMVAVLESLVSDEQALRTLIKGTQG
jgi:hypothetical protein